jgi:SPP1 gp7 family putative phage head morphogenesis protein
VNAARYIAHGKRPPKGGPARQAPPRANLFERQYLKRLAQVQHQFADHVETIGRRLLGSRADAARADTSGLNAELQAAYDALVKAAGLEQWLGRFAGQISDTQASYVKRIMRIPPGAGVARQRVIEDFRRENLRLIRGASEDQVTQVADVLRGAQAQGLRWEDTVQDVKDRLGVGLSRAKLIARDQTNKFNGNMMQLHQQASGISEYVWKTAGDMAVRGRPDGEYAKSKENHWALENTRHRWDQPPLIPGTTTHAHPGERIQCRCQALPVVPFFEE